MLAKVLVQHFYLVAVKMYQFAALFAFAVVADLCIPVALRREVFKARRTVCVDRIFCEKAIVHKALKMPVNCRLAYLSSPVLKIRAHVASANVLALVVLQIIEQYISLFCFVF